MNKIIAALCLTCGVTLLPSSHGAAERLEYFGKPVRGVPVSPVVKVGKLIFVSGTPGFKDGKVAVGDFPAQMKQVMENLSSELKSAGVTWDRVVKTNVLLTRTGDFSEMNRIYATYFTDGKYPARTTTFVAGLPSPDFLLEIDCEGIVE